MNFVKLSAAASHASAEAHMRRSRHGGRINRRVSNGDQVSRVASLAMKRGKSVDFTGYWQRHIAD
jgi:hypothetical protein